MLGEIATGVFSNSDALAREVLAAGDSAWDRAWRMPLRDDYQEALASNFAGSSRISSRRGLQGDLRPVNASGRKPAA